MQSSTIAGKDIPNLKSQELPNVLNFNYKKKGTFKYYCKKLNIIHYSTRGKYIYIEKQWSLIYQDMLIDMKEKNIKIESYLDLIKYLHEKCKSISNKKIFRYEYILRELYNYSRMGQEFSSNFDNYIKRLKSYAKHRNCKDMQSLKNELNNFLNRFIVDTDEKSKNTYETQDWLIISRYICDFLEYDDGISEPINLFA
jgi:hypothetical protein